MTILERMVGHLVFQNDDYSKEAFPVWWSFSYCSYNSYDDNDQRPTVRMVETK